ncbi:unnamed protein product [Bursaphelenchus okinawaensis]|uniref:Aryl hydrocarbon receptor n=1 Tax=Bursaphelenchus okinawaensis TaxID=465554 RepID=A0A811JTG9_9BILA|nr:unnamed protein product [Bursaphelenchus okinawaensis]CAG9082399.1 unnamed protein product [Bursaphelenchus okinawaensis]
MYASKRRQRNFKRVREVGKQDGPSNPSKRHRERLNGELEIVAGLLPYDESTLQRLDKLSVLRLAVSYLQIKAHFQVCSSSFPHQTCPFHPYALPRAPLGPIPSIIESRSGSVFVDPVEPTFTQIALRALGGFIIILSLEGEILYASENIELYLGVLQSDILHQTVFEMIHSEDRASLLEGLKIIQGDNLQRVLPTRFRSLLDNTCGFIRTEMRGRFVDLHVSNQTHTMSAFMAVCTPFVPPIQTEMPIEDPILKSKHSLDLSIVCLDSRLSSLFEVTDAANQSYYSFIHPEDAEYVMDAHRAVIKNTSSGLMVYRIVSRVTGRITFVQSSLRTFFKTNKADSIGGTHRTLTEVDGVALMEKRGTAKELYLTFDDTLLQSPRQINCISSLNPCSRSAPAREHKQPKLIPPVMNHIDSQHLPTVPLPMLTLNPTQLADNSVFFPPPLIPLTVNQTHHDFNGLAAVIPPQMHENELLWQQALKPSFEATYADITPSCYYTQPYIDPSIHPDISGSQGYYPPPHLLHHTPQIAKTYETGSAESHDAPFLTNTTTRYCDNATGFDPHFNVTTTELNPPTNNFTFFTEVAHILGNT